MRRGRRADPAPLRDALGFAQRSLRTVFPDLETGKQDDTHSQVKGPLL